MIVIIVPFHVVIVSQDRIDGGNIEICIKRNRRKKVFDAVLPQIVES